MHLVVDYVGHDGTLLHLYPQVADPKEHMAADVPRVFQPFATVALGDPSPGHPAWEVGPPYGTDMIIAIASSQPLFERPRRENVSRPQTICVNCRAQSMPRGAVAPSWQAAR